MEDSNRDHQQQMQQLLEGGGKLLVFREKERRHNPKRAENSNRIKRMRFSFYRAKRLQVEWTILARASVPYPEERRQPWRYYWLNDQIHVLR
jgi:hypothetical protein